MTPDRHVTTDELPSAPSRPLAGVRVLVVEDEAPSRRLLRTWLEAENAVVLEAVSAEQAVSLVQEAEGEIAVAVCDLMLPGHNGFWFAEELGTLSPATALVMATAVNHFDAALSSLHLRAVDYLHKPYPRERFIDALERAVAVYRARAEHRDRLKELEQRRREITEALAEIEANTSTALNAMLGLLQAREPIAYDHAHRVAKLSLDLAMALQITEPQLSHIERAALLHNLGRLALSDAMLNTPVEQLSPEDRKRLREYPVLGHAVLRSVPFLAGATEISLAAHERYDGSGFPYGLRGQAIPFGARIIGVADAYDELVSGIERPAVTPERAIAILTSERAAEFDPAVLAALNILHPNPNA